MASGMPPNPTNPAFTVIAAEILTTADECCVCYGQTIDKTRCGHLLCGHCVSLLPRPVCPLCRQELWIGAFGAVLKAQPRLRQVAANSSTQTFLAGSLGVSARLRSRRAVSQTRRQAPPVLPLSPGSPPAEQRQSQQRRLAQRNFLRRDVSPFFDWLRHHDVDIAADTLDHDRQVSDADVAPMSVSLPRESSPTAQDVHLSHHVTTAVRESSRTAGEGGVDGGGRRRFRIADLVARIGRMAIHESRRFVDHVAWLQQQGIVEAGRTAMTLLQALQRRLSELISVAPLTSLSATSDLVAALEATCVRGEALCDPLMRALEARLSYLLYNPTASSDSYIHSVVSDRGGHAKETVAANIARVPFEELSRLCACAAELRRRQLVGKGICATTTAHARKWLVRAMPGQLIRHDVAIVMLLEDNPSLVATLLERLMKLASDASVDAEVADRLARVVVAFGNKGLHLLDVDCGLAVEPAIASLLRTGVSVWPSHKLQMIMAVGGAWPRLCASRSTLADVARDALTLRIIQEVNRICVSLRRASDVPRIQEELGCWTACVRRATAEGLFTLAEPARNALVASASR
eukprot:TRINITY_DN29131_c0_g1_i3.p1 TRINITY_DN29131_c0_g1~~TRINITY_DN29131_c0_g1_i3.p1  ORF type:complete len:577 (-),score=63.77 TRINITY_DN29131_c0_g1_i3:128-1858(-)